MELLDIETRPVSFTTILCFSKKFQVVEIKVTFDACKRLAEEYVQAIIDSLHAKFPDMRVFNATKNFSPLSYPMELPLLYRNA